MCKVLMIAGIKPKNIPAAMAFVETMGMLMSKGNSDGLGYTAMTKDGNLFGKRWLDNDYAFCDRIQASKDDIRLAKQFPGLVDERDLLTEDYVPEMNEYGTQDLDNTVAMMLHTRYATSAKGLRNAHPFVTPDNKIALIHNGIIRNDKDFNLTLSTCDSEAILVSYMNQGVEDVPENIQASVNELEGYFAVGVMSAKNKTLDIFKSTAGLSFAYIKELGAFVFTTSEKDIQEACALLEYKHERISEFKGNQLLRLDAITGNMIKLLKFNDRPVYKQTYEGAKVYGHGGTSVPKMFGNTGKQATMTRPGSLRKLSAMETQEEILLLLNGRH